MKSYMSAGRRFRKRLLRYRTLRRLIDITGQRIIRRLQLLIACWLLSQTAVLLDEAKIREDARNVHQKSLEKDCTALKEENKMVRRFSLST